MGDFRIGKVSTAPPLMGRRGLLRESLDGGGDMENTYVEYIKQYCEPP